MPPRTVLALIAELDRREVWAAQGALSCAHWLSWAAALIPTRPGESSRCSRTDRAAAALRGAGEGRARLLQGPGADPHRQSSTSDCTVPHVEKFVRLHRKTRRGDRAGRCPARESRPHLLARGRRHRGAPRAVPAGDGRARPERTRCGDARRMRRSSTRRGGTTKVWCRRTSQRGRLDKTHPPPMQRQIPVLGNEPLSTGEKTPRCS